MRTYLLILAVLALPGMPGCQGVGSSKEERPGELAFRNNCQTCHRLPQPSEKSDSEWPALIMRYGQRANLSDRQIQLITEYLQSAN